MGILNGAITILNESMQFNIHLEQPMRKRNDSLLPDLKNLSPIPIMAMNPFYPPLTAERFASRNAGHIGEYQICQSR
jgi:hypothetical protein